MKRISILAGMLLVLAMLATSAFTHPLASRNGVVTSYAAGKTLTLHSDGQDISYALRGDTFANVQGLGTGARVTVWAECFGGHNSMALAALAPRTANVNPHANVANTNTCIAVFVLVRAAAPSGAGATGTSTPAPATTASPSASPAPSTTATPTP